MIVVTTVHRVRFRYSQGSKQSCIHFCGSSANDRSIVTIDPQRPEPIPWAIRSGRLDSNVNEALVLFGTKVSGIE